jgi:hypothetical protein
LQVFLKKLAQNNSEKELALPNYTYIDIECKKGKNLKRPSYKYL